MACVGERKKRRQGEWEKLSSYVGGSANELLQLISLLDGTLTLDASRPQRRFLSWQDKPNRHLDRIWLFKLALGLSFLLLAARLKSSFMTSNISHSSDVLILQREHGGNRHVLRLC
jgi:hypothetical protein